MYMHINANRFNQFLRKHFFVTNLSNLGSGSMSSWLCPCGPSWQSALVEWRPAATVMPAASAAKRELPSELRLPDPDAN